MTFSLKSTPLVRIFSFLGQTVAFKYCSIQIWTQIPKFLKILDVNVHFLLFSYLPHIWLDFLCFFGQTSGFKCCSIQIWTQIPKFLKILDFNVHFWPFPLLPHFLSDLLHFFGKLGVVRDALSNLHSKFKIFKNFWF